MPESLIHLSSKANVVSNSPNPTIHPRSGSHRTWRLYERVSLCCYLQDRLPGSQRLIVLDRERISQRKEESAKVLATLVNAWCIVF